MKLSTIFATALLCALTTACGSKNTSTATNDTDSTANTCRCASSCHCMADTSDSTDCDCPNEEGSTAHNPLVGRRALLRYPTLTAEVQYLTDSTLHWRTTTPEGKVAEGTERVTMRRLNEEQYFLNWIEADGTTVSQVIDLDQHRVQAYLSYGDAQHGRGGRVAQWLEGSFKLQ